MKVKLVITLWDQKEEKIRNIELELTGENAYDSALYLADDYLIVKMAHVTSGDLRQITITPLD